MAAVDEARRLGAMRTLSRPFLRLLLPLVGLVAGLQAQTQAPKVQVFILMGQSNMVGFGRIADPGKPGTLEQLCKEKGRYPHLRAPFVLATIGFDGMDLRGHGLTVFEAQMAVSGERGKYPQFAGNVRSIDARPFWRTKEQSPNQRQGHHYWHNAETYMEVGDALGRAMVELRNKR